MNVMRRYAKALHNESFAGMLLVAGALLALVWANSPIRESYFAIANTAVGPHALHLNLTIAQWAADGILTVFFFVVGLELKQEFTTGSLHDPRKAAVPIIAAACGMAGPSAVYAITQLVTGSKAFGGWAVPVATDIAFALAILSIFGKGLPAAARAFLMTLAVADDLGGIIVIAIFFSDGINIVWFAAALAAILLFSFLCKRRITSWWLLWPLAIIAWYAMHGSGIHATISGVALGMMVPARATAGESESLAARFSGTMEFYSSGFIVPIFAFFAAGVNIIDSGGFLGMLSDPVAIGIYLGLPIGKLIGISGGVWIMIRFFKLKLGDSLSIKDIIPVSIVTGIGFTVSLLIAQLSFTPTDPHEAHARVAVILGSFISVIGGAIALRVRQAQRLRNGE